MKTSNALLNTETQDVICQECGGVVDGISDAMKRTLKSFGQVVRSNEKRAFLLACKQCRANREVVLNENGDTVCKTCHSPISVTASFKLAMETSGTKLEKVKTKEKEEQDG
jgi:hypothetical protein